MTYHSASGERVIWYSYDSRGADYAEEITCISCDSSTTSLSQVLPNSGYIIVDGNERYCCWVVNYADYNLELNDMFISNDEPCSLISFRVDGYGPKIPYTSINGQTQVLDREINLAYHTLVWDECDAQWYEFEVIESFECLDDVLAIEPPLCNTGFVLTGDRFLQAWGLENAIVPNRIIVCMIIVMTWAAGRHAILCSQVILPTLSFIVPGKWPPMLNLRTSSSGSTKMRWIVPSWMRELIICAIWSPMKMVPAMPTATPM